MKPTFSRGQDCLQCHVSGRTLGVPGHFVRSLLTDGGGEMISGTDTGDVTHCAPLADRWGGWYVTGKHGAQTHLGNLVGLSAFDRHSSEPNYRGNLADLKELIDTGKYLSPRSDIVALMVLEHQVRITNLITRVGWETRLARADHASLTGPNEPAREWSATVRRRIQRPAAVRKRSLLMLDQQALAAPGAGTTGFTEA